MASDFHKPMEAVTSLNMTMAGGPFKTPTPSPTNRGRTNKKLEMSQETTEPIPRFLIIKKIGNEDFAKDSPFWIDKTLYGLVGRVKDIKKTREGLLIETVSTPQSIRLLKVEKFGEVPVEVTPHKTLNYSKGVISCRDFLNCETDEILDGLKSAGVVEVKRITTKKEGNIVNTGSIILTFNSPTLPTSIKAAFYSLKVRPYIPAPLRCFRCQGFGHVSVRCDKEHVCVCGHAPHEGFPCKTPITCVNCGGNHSARAKICPVYQEEQAIQRIKVEQKISFNEARRKVKETIPNNSMSYAQATISTSKQVNDVTDIVKLLIPEIVNICTATLQGKQIHETRPELNPFTTSSIHTMTRPVELKSSITSEKRKRYEGLGTSGEDASESEQSQLSQPSSQSFGGPKRKPGRPPKLKDNHDRIS